MTAFTVGWVYNLRDGNATTSAGSLVGIAIAFALIATLAVALRFYVRLTRATKTLALDDWIALGAAILCDVHSAVVIYQTRWGQALDPMFFPMQNFVGFGKTQYSGGIIYTVALVGFKLSLLATYYRVGGFQQIYRKIIVAVAVVAIVATLLFTLLLSFACIPIAKAWDVMLEGSCIDRVAAYYALGVVNIVLDIAVTVLPFPIIMKLHLPWKKKVGLGAMLALGLVITIAQIVRMTFVGRLIETTDSAELIKWSIIEITLGVFVACIPTFAPLLFPNRDTTTSSNRRQYNSSGQYNTWNSKPSIMSKIKGSAYSRDDTLLESQNTIKDRNIVATTEWTQVVEMKRSNHDSPV